MEKCERKINLSLLSLSLSLSLSNLAYRDVLGVKVTAFPLTHTIESFGYLFAEPERRGKLRKDKLVV